MPRVKGCEFLQEVIGGWVCPVTKVRTARKCDQPYCGNRELQLVCGNDFNRAISDQNLHSQTPKGAVVNDNQVWGVANTGRAKNTTGGTKLIRE